MTKFICVSIALAIASFNCTKDGDGPDGDEGVHGTARVGEACTAATDCAAGLTICNQDPGGQCTSNCTTSADCASVPGGAICETGGGHCYKLCTTKADCPRDGYDCIGGPNEQGKMWCDVVGP